MADDDDDDCDRCGGSGSVLLGQDYDGTIHTGTCPDCGGTGKA